jgi:Putative methyltransferase
MLCKVVPTAEEALTTRLLHSTIHALELYGIYLGKKLGRYTALKSGQRVTRPELVAAAGIAPRYWLPAEHANVLVADDHPAHLAPLAQMVAGIGGALGRVVDAYRTGDGVAYPHFGAAFRKGQAGINRPAFLSDLVTRWIPAAVDMHTALTSTRVRVADVGCGAGWSTIAMARAFPQAEVVGFDADEAPRIEVLPIDGGFFRLYRLRAR